MAFRRFNTLDEDLSISDSDEDDFQIPCDKTVDTLLADSDEESEERESSNNVPVRAPTSTGMRGAMSNSTNGRSQHSRVNVEEGGRQAAATSSSSRPSKMAVGETSDSAKSGPNFSLDRRGTTRNLISTSSTIRTRSRGLVSYADVEDVDLEEIIRKRNIQAPPRAPKNYVDNDQPITGTRRMLNANPEEMSLDQIIRGNKSFQQVPTVGRGGYVGRGRGMFHHRRQYPPHQHRNSQQGEGEKTQAHAQAKLKRGLETIVESQGEANVLDKAQFHGRSSRFLNVQEPWFSIKYLNERGYGTYCVLMKLKQEENLGELAERMFKCIITYNDISGVCEAAFSYQAKNGAAIDFLKKLCIQFPKIGPMPTKLSDEALMNGSALIKLTTKLKELRKVEFTANVHLTSGNDSHGCVLHKCVLNIDPYRYEGFSYQNSTLAKLNAIKTAYKDLIKEPFPLDRIYVGEQECTLDCSLYRDVVSRNVHCYDLTRTTVFQPGSLQRHFQMRGSCHKRGRGTRGRNGNVMVSVVEPK